jgi:uncharacterized protein with PQ loop repeat
MADLSLKTLIALTAGLMAWIAYGLIISDFIVALHSPRIRKNAALGNIEIRLTLHA